MKVRNENNDNVIKIKRTRKERGKWYWLKESVKFDDVTANDVMSDVIESYPEHCYLQSIHLYL